MGIHIWYYGGANNWQQIDWFEVNDQSFNYSVAHGMGWNVWYNGEGDFYLRYGVVPEPSTYIMVTGLLMLPGFRMFRSLLKKQNLKNLKPRYNLNNYTSLS